MKEESERSTVRRYKSLEMTAEPHTSGAFALLFLLNRLQSITSGSHVSAVHFYWTQLEHHRKLTLSLSQRLLINCRYASIRRNIWKNCSNNTKYENAPNLNPSARDGAFPSQTNETMGSHNEPNSHCLFLLRESA